MSCRLARLDRPDAFWNRVAPGVVGNGRPNTLRGPDTQAFDAAAIKHIPSYERWSAEARCFNVADRALFGQRGDDDG